MYKINYKNSKKIITGIGYTTNNKNITKIVDTIKEKTADIESIKISSQDIETMAYSEDFNLVLTYYNQRKRFKKGEKVHIVIPNDNFTDQCSILAIMKSEWIYDVNEMLRFTIAELNDMLEETIVKKEQLKTDFEIETNEVKKICIKDQIKICNYKIAVLKKGIKDKSGNGFSRRPHIIPKRNDNKKD